MGAYRALGSSDSLEMEDAKRERKRADMSHIRILNEAGNDVLRIDMGTGRVEVLRPKEIGDAARAWWDAVETVARATTSEASPRYRDLVFKDVGESGHARPNGDIIIQPGRAAPPMPEGSGGSVKIASEAHEAAAKWNAAFSSAARASAWRSPPTSSPACGRPRAATR